MRQYFHILVLLGLFLPACTVVGDQERREVEIVPTDLAERRIQQDSGEVRREEEIQSWGRKTKKKRRERLRKNSVRQVNIFNNSTNLKSTRELKKRGKVIKRVRRKKQLQGIFQNNHQRIGNNHRSQLSQNIRGNPEVGNRSSSKFGALYAGSVRKIPKDGNIQTVNNYDKQEIKKVLENKAQNVGDIVLINGKPAIIKKHRKYPKTIQRGNKTRQLLSRKLLKKRKKVRRRVNTIPGQLKVENEVKKHTEDNSTNKTLESFEDLQYLTQKSSILRRSGKEQIKAGPQQNHSSITRIIPSSSSSHLPSHLARNINYHTGIFTLRTVG